MIAPNEICTSSGGDVLAGRPPQRWQQLLTMPHFRDLRGGHRTPKTSTLFLGFGLLVSVDRFKRDEHLDDVCELLERKDWSAHEDGCEDCAAVHTIGREHWQLDGADDWSLDKVVQVHEHVEELISPAHAEEDGLVVVEAHDPVATRLVCAGELQDGRIHVRPVAENVQHDQGAEP
eukprot:CAMPEP_0206050574 /NCGR_PEP_ID=MMETSP1466-20131121/29534_1 /ASSEMBLY_ACC=CAM_ASM_001126 /TAXON_ID=44452 /ORGANISM="Pavlova gyrans, Strain CCMP608" /LENGTH=175 /DNA_ID=CAMNT_0053425691 /DNA_START=78 /DNA_END=606 /DNA_ORIENTATION=-